jgi:CMP-N,N'-diacetyllegionaminic acid synthase
MIVYCDIDGILMTQDPTFPELYTRAKPIKKNIDKLNKLYDEGNEIVLWTARGFTSGKDWKLLTENQLKDFGIKYHELRLDKPYYDMFIDDRARSKL